MPRNAGTRQRCDECGEHLRFPELEDNDDNVERLEEVDDDDTTAADLDEEERRQKYAGKPTQSKKKGICLLCENEGKGKFYTFYAAFLENVDRKHDYWSGQTTVRTTYSGMHKTGVFLCPECALGAWRKKYLLELILWSIPTVFFFFIALVIALTASLPGPRSAVIPMFLLGCVFLLIMMYPLYRFMVPTLTREIMERICIGLARRNMPEEGDSFFTNAEFRENFGRFPG
jgi:hypothetical protein